MSVAVVTAVLDIGKVHPAVPVEVARREGKSPFRVGSEEERRPERLFCEGEGRRGRTGIGQHDYGVSAEHRNVRTVIIIEVSHCDRFRRTREGEVLRLL